MTYKIKFVPAAMREWKKLPPDIQAQFRKKLKERQVKPHVPASRLKGMDNAYKIKLRAPGYRLVYQVEDKEITIYILATGRREKGLAYSKAKQRLT